MLKMLIVEPRAAHPWGVPQSGMPAAQSGKGTAWLMRRDQPRSKKLTTAVYTTGTHDQGTAPSDRGAAVGVERHLLPLSCDEFLTHQFPAIEYVIEPWLPIGGLAMVAGYRGIGKTYFALSLAYAVTTGGRFLGFTVPKPRKVLYVDGDLEPAELRERLAAIEAAAKQDENGQPRLAKQNFRIISHALQEHGVPDLADPNGPGRDLITAELGDGELLVLDHLSALYRNRNEDDPASWDLMQNWLLRLRRSRKAVLLVHHTDHPDKSGRTTQRGTSRHEDVLNTSILLWQGESGPEFNVEFTKAKSCIEPDPFVVRCHFDDGYFRLSRKPDAPA
jgi:putative DNA primase/helicase